MLENAQENGITLCEMNEGFAKGKSRTTSVLDLVTPGKLEAGNRNAGSEEHPVSDASSGLRRDNEGEKIFPNDATSTIVDSTAESILVSDHSNFAKSHLEHIGERLQNKMQALKALKSSLKPESKAR